MGDWIAFWDSDHSIYVNARHRDAHARMLAADIGAYIQSPTATLLDYGCGEALYAERIGVGRLILTEAAPRLRAALRERFANDPRVEVRSPADLEALPAGSVDLAVVNSVTQYLTSTELDGLLGSLRRLVGPNGLVLIGDVLPPGVPGVTDALALLRFSRAHGFLGAAIRGLVRTMLSDYMRLRSRLGLSRYAETEMIQKLRGAEFSAVRAASNIGHNQARMTFVARQR